MNRNFTPVTYSEIITKSIDLIADAYGYEYSWADVINLLDNYSISPDNKIVSKLLSQI
jgi:hypothetical protein